MKALTVQQPWAWAIIHGGKDVENRTQAWGYRGSLVIHAGRRISDRGVYAPPVMAAWTAATKEQRHEFVFPPLGAIIGVVDLVGVHVAADGCCESEWGEREYGDGRPGFERVVRRDIVHLEFEHPRPLPEPIPCRGALGLWTPASNVLDQLQEAER